MTVTYSAIGSYAGAAIAMGLGALGAGIGEGYAAGKAAAAITRQPAAATPIFNAMLIGQAIAETASIFALLVAFIMIFSGKQPGIVHAVSYVAAGLCP